VKNNDQVHFTERRGEREREKWGERETG